MDSEQETAARSASDVAGTPPEVLGGRYLLGALLGVGGSAWVHRAEDLVSGRECAVKLYPTGVGEPDRARQERELAVLSKLRHHNLVNLLDAGEDDCRAYLVMELVNGPTLSQRLQAGPMRAAEVARLGGALGDALAYVHERGITHRDVKPANVLLGRSPKLTDFGIARLVDTSRVTQTGYLVGTPAYLAPEQVSGGPVGKPVDVYALGLMLLEALTGRREYEGIGPEVAFARLTRPPSIPAGLPGLTEALHAMTATDPAVRPSAAEAAAVLWNAAPGLESAPLLLPPPDDELADTNVFPALAQLPDGSVLPDESVLPDGFDLPDGSELPDELRGDAALRGVVPVVVDRRGTRQRQLLAAALGALALAGAAVGLASAPTADSLVPPMDATMVAPQLPAPLPAQPAAVGATPEPATARGHAAARPDAVEDSTRAEPGRWSGRSGGGSEDGSADESGRGGSSGGSGDSSRGSGEESGSDSGGGSSSGSGSGGSGDESGG